MMCLNSVFPHFVATLVLRKYAPGTLTGLLLNLPIGLTVIMKSLEDGLQLKFIVLAGGLITFLTLVSLPYLFRLGSTLSVSNRIGDS